MNQNDFYKLKYSKYKSKYLELKQKNLEGGTKPKSGYYVFFINNEIFNQQDYKIQVDEKKENWGQDKIIIKSFVKKVSQEDIKLKTKSISTKIPFINNKPPTRNVKYDELCKISLLVIPCDDTGKLTPPSNCIFPVIDEKQKEGWKHEGCDKLKDIKITSPDLKNYFLEVSGCIKQKILRNILWVRVEVRTYLPNTLIDFGNFEITNEEKCKFLELKQ